MKVCPSCGFHHKLTAEERIAYTVDEGSWQELFAGLRSTDPLQFKDYPAKLAKSVQITGLGDGLVVGTATVLGLPLVLGVTDFRFMGGSMGSVAGRKNRAGDGRGDCAASAGGSVHGFRRCADAGRLAVADADGENVRRRRASGRSQTALY